MKIKYETSNAFSFGIFKDTANKTAFLQHINIEPKKFDKSLTR